MKETIISLGFDKDASGLNGNSIRKAICALFPGESLFSQHDDKGATIRRYPKIQYRVIKNKGVSIYGVNEGADMLEKIHSSLPKSFRIWTEYHNSENAIEYNVISKSIRISEFPDKLIGKTTLYRTVTPLLLIDRKERHEAYTLAESPQKKAELLQGWLINNLVNIAHDLQIPLEARVTVPVIELDSIDIKKKGISMTGLKGQFATNMKIGNLAIGRYSSHGYGVVQKIVL